MQIKNYRPIALTDTLYKIFTRIMTERLEKVVETYGLLPDEQQGFRADRSCLTAAMTMSMLMGRRKQDKKPFHVAYMDISKAYDTVDHEKLWQVLASLGIKGTWLENMKELYQDNIIKAITPWGKSKGVTVRRGIRQGCPLSPLLFALYVEPITREMKKVNPREDDEPSMLAYMQMTWRCGEKHQRR